MDFRLKEDTISGLVSELMLTSLKRPPYSRSKRSSTGPSALEGAHQGAQKATRTGTSIEPSITSRSKDDNVASIIEISPHWIESMPVRAVGADGLNWGRTRPASQAGLLLPVG